MRKLFLPLFVLAVIALMIRDVSIYGFHYPAPPRWGDTSGMVLAVLLLLLVAGGMAGTLFMRPPGHREQWHD